MSRVDPGTIAESNLIVGDRIVDVNGTPVCNRDTAKDLICQALAQHKPASMIVERPTDTTTKDQVSRLFFC